MTHPLWHYRARLIRVVDGDTLDVTLDLGLDVHLDTRLRLDGLDAPELHAADPAPGQAARDWITAWMANMGSGWGLVVETRKHEKYGRYLARVTSAWSGECLNDVLIETGHAQPWDGSGPRPK